MSTHNIGFYEDLTKIIFGLSPNIIKYLLISSAAITLVNCGPGSLTKSCSGHYKLCYLDWRQQSS